MNRIILVFTILLFVNISCKKQISELVKIEGGIIKGTYINDLFVSKGVPFAALPLGELHWKAPQPIKKKVGKRNGIEIVQVHLHKVNDINGLIKTLKGFQRVIVSVGKIVNAVITLSYSSFEFYDRNNFKITVNQSECEVLCGSSSDNKDLKMFKINIQ